uniref:TIR domain-containing protein n=1 Tax=Aplanochytrium stocchinoi TaxID=215587 RepID=A0A7S3PPV2_9STRA
MILLYALVSLQDPKKEKSLRKKLDKADKAFRKRKAKYLKRRKKNKSGKAAENSTNYLRNKKINFKGKQLSPAGVKVLISYADYVANTLSLILSKNELGDSGTAAIAETLKNSYTEVLDLQNNNITDKGAKSLAKHLPQSRVRELLLQNNKISEEGIKQLIAAIPFSVELRKLNISKNTKLSKDLKKQLKKALRAEKTFKPPEELIDETKALESNPPPAPNDDTDKRGLEKKANGLLSRLLNSSKPSCGSDGKPDSALVAKFESLTNYSSVIPMLRDTQAAEVLMPLASGEIEGLAPSDQVRAAMAVANLVGDTNEGAKRLRDLGILSLLLAQLQNTIEKPNEPFKGVKWDLGHVMVPMLALSTNSTNAEALKPASDLILSASATLLDKDRPGDVERAVNSLGHLTATGQIPSDKIQTQVMLRNVRDRAARLDKKGVDNTYLNAGFEAASLMEAIEQTENGKVPLRISKLASKPAGVEKDVMISYSWAQKPVAKHLKIQLERRGITVHFDEHFMSANIYQKMASAIQTSKAIIVCASHEYRLSANCQREANFSADLKKKIVPVIAQEGYQPEDWLGFIVAGLLYYDLSILDGRKFSETVETIVTNELRD